MSGQAARGTPSAVAPGYGSAAGYGVTPGAVSAGAYPSASPDGYAAANGIPDPNAGVQAAYPTADRYGVQDRGVSGAAHTPTRNELRRAAYQRALTASAVYSERTGPRAGRTGRYGATGAGAALAPGFGAGGANAAYTASSAAGVPPGAAGWTGGAGAPNASGEEAGTDAAPAGRYGQFLASAARPGRTAQALTVDPAPGAYAVQAGSVIPAVLLTEINSDLPGECLAQIARDVFDTRTQHVVLIPRGSKLLCRYDDQLGAGQSRLLVAWTRILLPDGRSIQLPGLPATDQAGARGVSDQVDRHLKRTFGAAGALSLLSAGLQLSQPRSGNILASPSTGQIAAGALGQELNQVGVELLRRDLVNQQTIRIRQGTQFNVFLNTDLLFPGPYTQAASTGDVLRTMALTRGGAPR